jgi:hypothetical protein
MYLATAVSKTGQFGQHAVFLPAPAQREFRMRNAPRSKAVQITHHQHSGPCAADGSGVESRAEIRRTIRPGLGCAIVHFPMHLSSQLKLGDARFSGVSTIRIRRLNHRFSRFWSQLQNPWSGGFFRGRPVFSDVPFDCGILEQIRS